MKKHFLGFLLLWVSFSTIHAQLVINELMSNNVSYKMDELWNYSMWVEIYNSSNSAVNQADYYFTDDLSKPRKWKPASKSIPAKGFSLLWFEREDVAGHANFKLDPAGGKLYIINSANTIVDQVTYPAQKRNISYGRITDGATDWVFFENPSPAASNNGKQYASERCKNPVLKKLGGFYTGSSVSVGFETPAAGETIRYTTDGKEPTLTSSVYTPGTNLTYNKTTVLRAKTFATGKLSSDVISTTFFLEGRTFDLPVNSIITDPLNLFDNTIGIYTRGTNGITGRGQSTPANWNRPWYRPANYELFDVDKICQINQELDIAINGGYTRSRDLKSLRIKPRNKFGNNHLNYDFFPVYKPNHKYKEIILRNSGNDFGASMIKDGFIQSLFFKSKLNLDLQGYQPSVVFMNGEYYGIENIRERAASDYVYSNYGLKDNEFYFAEDFDLPDYPPYIEFINYVTKNDITKADVYDKVCEMMDMDNYLDYVVSMVYCGNQDWPWNNLIMWRPVVNGKWRWITYDTDSGFETANPTAANEALDRYYNGRGNANENYAQILPRELAKSQTFVNRLVDRFAIRISTDFEANRVIAILDSVCALVKNEIPYHQAKWGGNHAGKVNTMRNFANSRQSALLAKVSDRYLNNASIQMVNILSNIPHAQYMFNSEPLLYANANIRYFNNRQLKLEAKPVKGQKFKHWEYPSTTASTLLPMGSVWKYYDKGNLPASDWISEAYNDAAWASGPALLGFGSSPVATIVSFGPNANSKYISTYFRSKVTISQLASKSNFTVTIFVDDGAVIYVNGREIGRVNMPSGTITYSTLASAAAANNGITQTLSIPQSYLKEGDNTIAVEVHQNSASSTDLYFDLSVNYINTGAATIATTNPVFSTTVTGTVNIRAVYEASDEPDPDILPAVFINEVMAGNSLFPDENGKKNDYIELYNAEDTPIDIGGWYISDKPVRPTLAQIPKNASKTTTIPPKGFLVIWTDNNPSAGPLHVDFALSKQGETITLSRPDPENANVVQKIDCITFPALNKNESFSRTIDGGPTWAIRPGTPGKTNIIIDNNDGDENGDGNGDGDGDGDKGNDTVLSYQLEESSGIRLYPTIISDRIYIENAQGQQVSVYNVAGIIVSRTICVDHRTEIPVKNLPAGLYIITVGKESFRIVIQR